MLIFISKKNLKQLGDIMSKFTDDFNAALEKVASTQNDAAAIQGLKNQILAINSLNAEQSAALLALAQKLGEAPVTPES